MDFSWLILLGETSDNITEYKLYIECILNLKINISFDLAIPSIRIYPIPLAHALKVYV